MSEHPSPSRWRATAEAEERFPGTITIPRALLAEAYRGLKRHYEMPEVRQEIARVLALPFASSEQTLNMDAPKAATDYRDAARYRWLRERVTYRDQESLSPMKYYYRRWFHDTAYKLDADTAAGMFDASIDEGMKPRIEREYK